MFGLSKNTVELKNCNRFSEEQLNWLFNEFDKLKDEFKRKELISILLKRFKEKFKMTCEENMIEVYISRTIKTYTSMVSNVLDNDANFKKFLDLVDNDDIDRLLKYRENYKKLIVRPKQTGN